MRWLRILAIQAAIVVALLEIALRVYQPLPFRLRGDDIVLPVGLRYQFDNGGDPKLDPVTVHTRNAMGFRGPDWPRDFASRLTIVAVGGSTTECFPISDGKTWPDIMARELAAVRPDVWVNNAGLDGHSTVGHLALLRSAIVPLKPKVMLILAGLNDVGLDALRPQDEVAGVYPYFRPFWQGLTRYSEIANTVLNLERARRARGIAYVHEPMNVTTHPRLTMTAAEIDAAVARLTAHVDRFEPRLMAIIGEAKAAGIEPILITQPSMAGEAIDPTTGTDLGTLVEHDGYNGHVEWRALERYNDVTRRVAGRERVFLIDLARLLPKDSRYFYDLYHFGNAGAEAVGTIVAARLRSHLLK
jgi:lysophospholipase L1-like esterase